MGRGFGQGGHEFITRLIHKCFYITSGEKIGKVVVKVVVNESLLWNVFTAWMYIQQWFSTCGLRSRAMSAELRVSWYIGAGRVSWCVGAVACTGGKHNSFVVEFKLGEGALDCSWYLPKNILVREAERSITSLESEEK